MSISYRRSKDVAKADDRAAATARGEPYTLPSAMFEFRRRYNLSHAAAAALLGFQQTWWQWRESGNVTMRPDQFAAAQAGAATLKPVPRTMAERVDAAETQLAALQARVMSLEAALFVLQARQDAAHPAPGEPHRAGATLI